MGNKNISAEKIASIAPAFPIALQQLWLKENKLRDAGFNALLEAIPRTDFVYLRISVPSTSPFRRQFESLRNRQGDLIHVNFL